MAFGAIVTGIAGRIYFQELSALPGNDPENLFPALARHHLHPVMFGIVVSSIFAAIMSTADSQLLVAASAVVRDVYEKIINKGRSIPQKKLMLTSRIVVLVLVGFALLMGFIAGQLVFWLVLFAWAGLGASLGSTSILALYWKGTSRTGVIAGVLTGAITVVIWNQTTFLKEFVYELIPGFVLAMVVTLVVSRFTKKPSHTKEAFEAMLENAD